MRLTDISLMPQASSPSFKYGVRVTGASVGVSRPMSVITPVHTAPDVAVAWHPYSLSLHMKDNTLPVTLHSPLSTIHVWGVALRLRTLGSKLPCSSVCPCSPARQSHKHE